MKVDFVKVNTEDGIELHGIVSGEIRGSIVILHTHGLAGNFYENRFISTMAKQYPSHNITFISFNNRGHDYIADVLKDDAGEVSFIRKGGAHDRFEDCVKDIRAWVNFAMDNGAKKIFLQGHSVGAAKVTYYYISTNDSNISGLILISPSDDVSWGMSELGEKYNDVINHAKRMIKDGNGDDLIPYKSFSYPMDAETFLATFEGITPQSMFHSPSLVPDTVRNLGNIRLPIIITIGTVNEAYVGKPEDYVSNLRKIFKETKLATEIIRGAGHSYIGYEKTLTDKITQWIEKV